MSAENESMNVRRALFTVIVIGIIVVAATGGIFHTLASTGKITAEVTVSGRSETETNQFNLYVDGEKAAFQTVNEYNPYDGYGTEKHFNFKVRVTANRVHTFQVKAQTGEESVIVEKYIPFGDSTHISNLRIENIRVFATITGINKLADDITVYFIVDDIRVDTEASVSINATFSSQFMVDANQYHNFEVSMYQYNIYNTETYRNSTWVYVGITNLTVNLDLP